MPPVVTPFPTNLYTCAIPHPAPQPIGKIPEGLTCAICMSVPFPYAYGCERGHGFCSSCIETWTRVSPVCPVCKTDLPSSKIKMATKMTGKIWSNVEYECVDCDWRGLRKDLHVHMMMACPKTKFICRQGICSFAGTRGEIEEHVPACPHRGQRTGSGVSP